MSIMFEISAPELGRTVTVEEQKGTLAALYQQVAGELGIAEGCFDLHEGERLVDSDGTCDSFGLCGGCLLLKLKKKVVAERHLEDKGLMVNVPTFARALLSQGGDVQLMVEAGVAGMQDTEGMTALMHAARGHPAAVKLLLEAQADVDAADCDGITALHLSSAENYPDIVKLLLDAGADVDVTNEFEESPLHCASKEAATKVVSLLLSAGADTEKACDMGTTPLMIACEIGSDVVVGQLLQKGADIEAKNDEGWTPLMNAAMYSHTRVVRKLLDAGADVQAKNNYGDDTLDIALKCSVRMECVQQSFIEEVVTMLLRAGANPSDKVLCWATSTDVVSALVSKNLSTNQLAHLANRFSSTPGLSEGMAVLLPVLDTTTLDTALCQASRAGNTEVIKLLETDRSTLTTTATKKRKDIDPEDAPDAKKRRK